MQINAARVAMSLHPLFPNLFPFCLCNEAIGKSCFHWFKCVQVLYAVGAKQFDLLKNDALTVVNCNTIASSLTRCNVAVPTP